MSEPAPENLTHPTSHWYANKTLKAVLITILNPLLWIIILYFRPSGAWILITLMISGLAVFMFIMGENTLKKSKGTGIYFICLALFLNILSWILFFVYLI